MTEGFGESVAVVAKFLEGRNWRGHSKVVALSFDDSPRSVKTSVY